MLANIFSGFNHLSVTILTFAEAVIDIYGQKLLVSKQIKVKWNTFTDLNEAVHLPTAMVDGFLGILFKTAIIIIIFLYKEEKLEDNNHPHIMRLLKLQNLLLQPMPQLPPPQ